ncbi:hypothetical protein [Streptomyces sp. Z26]|uniref:hypothetical protein n=1 Tax=Streptomyces sp. Z26 TaxID=2500177 RepID=UPI000EF13ECE|nr:hypothetical protein [Streptomyces sp. Z26]RLL68394.1 hypothetical protein D7M15_17905 [Streptomyces sp. Z26]
MSTLTTPEIAGLFARSSPRFGLRVVRAEGPYRHLVTTSRSERDRRYEVVTWPGSLVVRDTDDSATYTFSGPVDLTGFARAEYERGVDVRRWNRLMASGSSLVMAYSEREFRRRLAVELAAVEPECSGITAAWDAFLDERDVEEPEEAYAALATFAYQGETFLWLTHETGFEDYHFAFVWACHIGAWAVTRYAADHAPEPTAPPMVQSRGVDSLRWSA